MGWFGIGPINTAPLVAADYVITLRDRDTSDHRITVAIKFHDLAGVAQHRIIIVHFVIERFISKVLLPDTLGFFHAPV